MPIVKSNQKSEMSVSRNSIAEARVRFASIISSTMQRASQATDTVEIKELGRNWAEIDNTLQQNLSIGVKLDLLIANLKKFLEVSKSILHSVEANTPLDVSSELQDFHKLNQIWQDLISQYENNWKATDGFSNEAFLLSIDARQDSLDESVEDIQKSLNTNNKKIQTLEDDFKKEIIPHKQKYDQFLAEYDAAKPAIDARIAELDKLLGLQGKKVLAGRFEVDATNEEKAANIFRRGAVSVMAIAILVITLSYYELSEFDLSPSGAAVRIIFSLILSVPAAYLARESSKHRQ